MTRSLRALFAAACIVSTIACNKETTTARNLVRSCDAGEAAACDTVALRFQKGEYVLRDAERAATLYGQACTGGVGDACASLGVMYQRATGVKRDSAHAAQLFQQGCDRGGLAGCTHLGALHQAGLNVPRDPDRAAALYKRACDGDNVEGCARLGATVRDRRRCPHRLRARGAAARTRVRYDRRPMDAPGWRA